MLPGFSVFGKHGSLRIFLKFRGILLSLFFEYNYSYTSVKFSKSCYKEPPEELHSQWRHSVNSVRLSRLMQGRQERQTGSAEEESRALFEPVSSIR